jgi:enterochelin esterase family protein
MGGMQTLNIGFSHLDKFAYLGVFSSGIFGGGPRTPGAAAPAVSPIDEWVKRRAAALNDAKLKPGLKLFWMATGKDDFLLKTSQATVEMFKRHGYSPVYKETEGAHTWLVWRAYLNEFALQLFQ